jgi:hypothetical protein
MPIVKIILPADFSKRSMTDNKELIAIYQEYLEQAGKSANTVKVYFHDVAATSGGECD